MADVKTETDALEDVAVGCDAIIRRVEDYTISSQACEDVVELESYHDALAREVGNLAGMLKLAVQAVKGSPQ